MLCNASGPSWNSGFTSSTTRYWLVCVKIVETSRWPKALYSALSITAGVMPKRLAVARSMSTYACRPPSCRSLATSVECGTGAAGRRACGTHVDNSCRIGVLDGELVLRAADAVLDRQVLHRLHVQRDAFDAGELACRRRMTSVRRAVTLRQRLQVDQHASAVERRIGAVDADERRQALDGGILRG